MPVQEYALYGTRRVQIFQKPDQDGETFTILLDRSIIGSVTNEEATATGREFGLADGSVLKVELVNNQIQVLRNGLPLPLVAITGQGAASGQASKARILSTVDPKIRRQFRASYLAVFFIAILNILFGFVFLALPSNLTGEQQIVAGVLLVFGVLYVALGVFVARWSSVALGLAVTLYCIDVLLNLFQGNLAAVFLHIVLLIPMIRGFNAIRAIRNAEIAVQF